ncbi:MAG TPA: glucans biosynthesis glucosyltransferase MdoH [Caulobacteraceae bacterium]|nr:glucans biosynthesis glucosyltransferase MdoH [Caulobacteraceae bacterium]
MNSIAYKLEGWSRARDLDAPGWGWLPDEAPLEMPRQSLDEAPALAVTPSSRPRDIARRRAIVFGATAILTFLAAIAPFVLYAREGWDKAEMFGFGIFLILIGAIACWFCSAAAGFIVLLKGREQEDLDFRPKPPAPRTRTALLMPLYHEDPQASFARLAMIDASLHRLGVSDAFDIFVLSDSVREDAAAAERNAYQAFRLHAHSAAYYRRREQNIEHKAGNIVDWTCRFGGAYDFMVVLDADSTMAGETVLRLVDAMERHPGVGLIQTSPTIVGASTLFARVSQFSVRLYGRVAAAGYAWWTGSEGSYWGHNAIVRVRAFAGCAGLPILPGEKPFGGNVLSHDVVEAALLRRAGWAVHVTAALDGSCEETPALITEFMRRDHRWCQGNLQHLSLVNAAGLSPISRLTLIMGCLAYVSSPLWLASLAVGLGIQLQYPVDWGSFWYFLNPSFSPFMLASILCGLLLIGPKLMGCALVLSRPRERRAFGGTKTLLKGMAAEIFLSAMLAPILMVANTHAVLQTLRGYDAGWHAQQRDADGLAWGDAFRMMGWQMFTGACFAVALCWRPDLVAFFVPIVLPLLLSPAIAVWTSRRRWGEAFAERGYLLTPDENAASATAIAPHRAGWTPAALRA